VSVDVAIQEDIRKYQQMTTNVQGSNSGPVGRLLDV